MCLEIDFVEKLWTRLALGRFQLVVEDKMAQLAVVVAGSGELLIYFYLKSVCCSIEVPDSRLLGLCNFFKRFECHIVKKPDWGTS